jgi:DNA-binding MarR family transcriptional regulator
MENKKQQPFGRLLTLIGKNYLHALQVKLSDLDVERNFYALILIDEGKGKITQQELAELLESDKVSVVRIIDNLSDLGYVKREKVEADRRKYSLVLTAKAKKELPGIKTAIAEVTDLAFRGLSVNKVEEIYADLHIIKNNLNNRN